jgi:cytochrome P450
VKYVPAWLPGAGFKRYAAQMALLQREMRDRPVELTQTQMVRVFAITDVDFIYLRAHSCVLSQAAGTAPISMVQRMLDEDGSSDPEMYQAIKDVAGIVYLAGLDTTVATVVSFFLAMVIYPDIQLRAQAELDEVIGRGRLPEFSDRKDLPYVHAIVSECLRWLPVLPMGSFLSSTPSFSTYICIRIPISVSPPLLILMYITGAPHLVTQDDEYRGYYIPKGTLALPAQWALLHDPELYPNPEQFMPERYLERSPSGAWSNRTDVRDPRDFCFGFGRRICPGVHIAEQSLFAMVATALHTLRIERSKDIHGEEIIPQPDVCSGLLSHPDPFEYTIRMRDDAKDLVQICSTA